MKVLVTNREKWQLEKHLCVLRNPYETIARRRLAKSKFDLIYKRAAKRFSERKTVILEKKHAKLANLNEGE